MLCYAGALWSWAVDNWGQLGSADPDQRVWWGLIKFDDWNCYTWCSYCQLVSNLVSIWLHQFQHVSIFSSCGMPHLSPLPQAILQGRGLSDALQQYRQVVPRMPRQQIGVAKWECGWFAMFRPPTSHNLASWCILWFQGRNAFVYLQFLELLNLLVSKQCSVVNGLSPNISTVAPQSSTPCPHLLISNDDIPVGHIRISFSVCRGRGASESKSFFPDLALWHEAV